MTLACQGLDDICRASVFKMLKDERKINDDTINLWAGDDDDADYYYLDEVRLDGTPWTDATTVITTDQTYNVGALIS